MELIDDDLLFFEFLARRNKLLFIDAININHTEEQIAETCNKLSKKSPTKNIRNNIPESNINDNSPVINYY